MLVSALKCLVCESVVWSKYRHDFCSCSCGQCFIDGGRDYTRYGAQDMGKIALGLLDTETDVFRQEEPQNKDL